MNLLFINSSKESIFCVSKIKNLIKYKNKLITSTQEKKELSSISHPIRKKQWLSSRILLQTISQKKKICYLGILKKNKKPYLINSKKNISISHSQNLVAIALSSKNVGIDIQKFEKKIINIKKKFLNEQEINYNNLTIKKLTTLWCAKESIYKIIAPPQIIKLKEIIIEDFNQSQKGILKNTKIPNIKTEYLQTNQYCLVLSTYL